MKLAQKKKNVLLNLELYLGMAYQIIDDSLDYFSDFKTSGKSSGNDLKEGKMSLLGLYFVIRDAEKVKKRL